MSLLKQIIKCKLLGNHNMIYVKGYGYRCSYCGKAMKETNKGMR